MDTIIFWKSSPEFSRMCFYRIFEPYIWNCEITYMLNIPHGIWFQKMSKNISLRRTLVSSYLIHVFPPNGVLQCFVSFCTMDFSSVQVPLLSQMCFHQGCLAFNQGPKEDYVLLKSLSRCSIFVFFSPQYISTFLNLSASMCLIHRKYSSKRG